MRNRIFAVLAIAVLAGGGLAYATYSFVQSRPGTGPATEAPTQAVVVAAADLQMGASLGPDDLKVMRFPEGQAPEGAFADPAEAVGRGVIAPMVKNEVVLAAKLAGKDAGAGLPPLIPEGMRAVSVRVNEVVGVAGYVLPGTRVDVLATHSPTNQPIDTVSRVVLANVQVLAAGTRIEQDQTDQKAVQVSVVTLLVDPEQAERLALASTEGKIQLALRNPLDQGSPQTPGIRPAVLMGTGRAVAPSSAPRTARARTAEPVTTPAPPPPPPTVEVIRGDKRANEVIK